MKESKIYIKYKIGNKVYEDDLYQNQHYTIEAIADGENGVRFVFVPREKIELVSFELKYLRQTAPGEKFFVNGYQAWTTSREMGAGDVQKGLTPLAKIIPFAKIILELTGDYAFTEYSGKPGKFHSFTYTYFRKENAVELYGSLNERTGFTIFSVDMDAGEMRIAKDVAGAVVTEPYEILNVVKISGEYDEVFDKYFALMNIPKPRLTHMAGYTSWYNYFGNIDESIINRDIDNFARVGENADIFQIDDGYQTFVGDWIDPNPAKFPSGMKAVADRIHDKGYMAGLWLAPFNASKKSRVAREHPDWFLKKPNGKPATTIFNWGGAHTLDIYNEEAREYIAHCFDVVLNEWGFDMVKLDFLYSHCIKPRNGKCRGMLMAEGMDFLRECVGDKLILGCGVPLGSAFGIVDACRIGCDVVTRYKGRYYTNINLCAEIPSAHNAINNAVFRRHLDGRAFCNDPDVFFLRDYNLKYTDMQKKLLARINHLFGNVLFVSDDVGTYNEEQLELLYKTFAPSNAIIISAEYTDKDYFTIKYLEDGERKTLAFDLKAGETSSEL